MSKNSWVGQTLNGRYQIQELLGQGGMSAVYKAKDPNLQRVVAIKLIHSHLSGDPDFVRRFEDEARAVAQMRHPQIVQVYDFDHDEDTYYMVLEFVPGETLQARLRRLDQAGRHLDSAEALKYAVQICEAIDFAHQRGMIHRDIKPANIMLNVMGDAILMDFGIAKIMGGEQHTATGAVVGTAMYMSPEQIKGITIDERSDIYSLGVTLYEMFSGRPPYEADSAMTLMMMHLNDPIPDVRALNPQVPDEVIAIIEKALAKERENRYASAAAFGADLQRALDQLQSPAAAGETAVEAPVESQVLQPEVPQSDEVSQETLEEQVAQSAEMSGTYVEPPLEPQKDESTFVEPQPVGAPPGGSGAVPREPPAGGSSRPPSGPRKLNPLLIGGGAVIIVIACLAVIGFVILPRILSGSSPAAAAENTPLALAVADTMQPSPSPMPSDTPVPPTPTRTPLPSLTPTITLTPTPTVPPGIPYVRINNISIDDQQRYVVEYETFEYTEKLPGMHVHFFFDTVPPDQAGYPGRGPWILYGGPRPFTKYNVSDRPADAQQMCALVANPNHSVQADSGNCFDLPEGT